MEEGQAAHNFWHHEEYGHNQEATAQLNNYFPQLEADLQRLHPKPWRLINRCVRLSAGKEGLVLDFFAGSGTTAEAVLRCNHEDSGSRKYLLVELGSHFEEVLKPRIHKAVFAEEWEGGVPQEPGGSTHMFRYQELESYEDSLTNITISGLDERDQQTISELEVDDYTLSYMLDFESSNSASLLTKEAFEDPFSYRLAIQHGHETAQQTVVDLVETFHYLIGMHVESFRSLKHQERPYVVTTGTVQTDRGIENVLTCWRHTQGLDFDREAEWFTETVLQGYSKQFDHSYVNGTANGLCHIPGAEPLDIVFHELMMGVHA
jgi:adenine-specific DNA-methyltransferase